MTTREDSGDVRTVGAAPEVLVGAAPEVLVGAAPGRLRGAVEAVLLVVDEPVSAARLAAGLAAPEGEVLAVLEEMRDRLRRERSGIALREIAGGWRLFTAEEFADAVAAFLLDGQATRLSQAALETLAVIAYRQPVSRARVSAVRGDNVDGVVRTLMVRGLVEERGAEEGSGALLYGTTPLFLERLGLSSLSQLPPLAPLLPDVGGLEDLDLPPTVPPVDFRSGTELPGQPVEPGTAADVGV